ncbi:MAG: DUF2510 domain-containing protein [Terrimesophilobacter sp.]
MTPDQTAPVPAGWYPDPYGASELRWWDGQNWTDSVHPPVSPSPAPEPQASETTQTEADPVAGEPAAAAPVVAAEPIVAEPVAAEPDFAAPVASADAVTSAEAVTAAPVIAEYTSPPSVVTPLEEEPTPSSALPEHAQLSAAEPLPAHDLPPLVEPVLAAQPAADAELPTGPEEAISLAPATPELETPPAVTPATGLPSRRELRQRTVGESEGPLSAHASAPEPAVPDASTPSAFDWMATGVGETQTPPDTAPPTNTQSTTPTMMPAASRASAFAPAEPVAVLGTEPSAGSGSVPVVAAGSWEQEPAASTVNPEELYRSTATRKATVSGWFIAIMPLITGILAIGAVKGAENYPRYVPAGMEWWVFAGAVIAVSYIATVILAIADRRKLDWAGYNHPAHWAWALLSAPIYLLVRTIVVKRETGRNSALLWVWIALTALLVGAWFATTYFAPELIAGYTLPFL